MNTPRKNLCPKENSLIWSPSSNIYLTRVPENKVFFLRDWAAGRKFLCKEMLHIRSAERFMTFFTKIKVGHLSLINRTSWVLSYQIFSFTNLKLFHVAFYSSIYEQPLNLCMWLEIPRRYSLYLYIEIVREAELSLSTL